MISFNFSNTTKILFGSGKLNNFLLKEVKKSNISRVFLVTDPGLVETGLIESVTNLLKRQNLVVHVYSDVKANPSSESIMKGASNYQETECDLLLAIGGGSPIDFAKAVGVVVSHDDHVLNYVHGAKSINQNLPFLICVPTTAGTGSEVTSVAVVTEEQQNRKRVLASPHISPDVAIVDPDLTASLPRHMVAATGMDAFVHAIESYTSINANPFTDSLALQSIKMLKEHLPASYAHSFNKESREQVHIASTMAGVAFNAAGLGLVHACSHPLTAMYQVPHGLANAIILPKVIDYNLIANKHKYADIARILKPELISCDDDSAASYLVEALEEFNKQVDIPIDFSYLEGVMPEDIDKLVHDALHDQLTVPFNPRKVTPHDIKQIYQKLLPQLNTDSIAYSK